LNKHFKIILNYFLGPLLFIVLSWSLYKQIINQQDLDLRWLEIKESWMHAPFWLVIFLMFLNWGIEARKWQLLVAHVQKLSFVKALKSVFAGCSVTMLTPNRVGEYGGRILYVEEGNRIKAISLTIIGSISQLLITMIVGCLGLLYFRFFSQNTVNILSNIPTFWSNGLIYLSIAVTVFLFLFYLRIGWLVRMMEKVNAFQKITKHISVLDEFDNKQLLNILLLSFIRYLVFVLQYILLMYVMHVGVGGWISFWLMSVFYLIMAIAPTFGFIELPVRAKASWEIFKWYTGNELGVGAAALGIWLINLVIPAIIGSLLILSVKIVKENDTVT
jgi:hypothetical protein